MGLICNSNLRFIKAEEGDRAEFFMIHIIMIKEIIKIGIDQIVEIGKFSLVDRVDQGIKNYRRGKFRHNARLYQHFGRKIDENIEVIIGTKVFRRQRGRCRSRERLFSRNINNRSRCNSRSRSVSPASTNRDIIRCYRCTEYDHFVKDFSTAKEEGKIEQIQQMFNLDEEPTSLKH